LAEGLVGECFDCAFGLIRRLRRCARNDPDTMLFAAMINTKQIIMFAK